MNNRLSHSSMNTYNECPKKWELHYRKRLRSKTTHAALLFGSALDKSVETLVNTRNYAQAELVFDSMWNEQEINGVKTELASSELVVYANSDYDKDLLIDSDWKLLECNEEDINALYTKKDEVGFDKLHVKEKRKLNLANWLCLYHKGKLMLSAFNEFILPCIEEVYGTQVPVELTNEDGDKLIGFVDMVVKWKGKVDPVIFDLKTSSRLYEDDAVTTSQQLCLYTYALSEQFKTKNAGFIVLNKHIRKNKTKICSVCGYDGSGASHKTCPNEVDGKRCKGEWAIKIDPTVFTQVLIDEIPSRLEEIVLENLNSINSCIKHDIFPRSLTSCKAAYGKCAYYNLCLKNTQEGLIETEERKQ